MWVMISSDNKAVCQQTLSSLEPLEGNNILVVNGGYDDYLGLDVPGGWDVMRFDEVKGQNAILNMLFRLHPDEEHYGIIPDNCLIEAVNFDSKLKAISKGRYVVTCNDGNLDPFPFTGVRIWAGKLIRKVGWWGLPDTFHAGFDWAWIKLAWDMVSWERAPDIRVTYFPKSENQIDLENKKHEEQDKVNFDIWRRNKYHLIFRNLMFGGDKWTGRTNFPKENGNGEETGENTATQEVSDDRQAL